MTNNPLPNKRKVLLTGAAGCIATLFRQHADNMYHFRLVDRNMDRLKITGDHEVMEIDVAELDACQEACRGIDTVVHLAADASPEADFYDSLLENNIKGVYNIFQAAKDQGCKRVIFASSVRVIDGYPLDEQAHPESPVKPLNMYAASKCFGEAVAHYFAAAHQLSSIVIRIGSFADNSVGTDPDSRTLSTFVSRRDLCQLIVRSVEIHDVQFAIVHGISNNRFKRMSLTSTKEILGYSPQDDAFQLFETGLYYESRWVQESQNGIHKHTHQLAQLVQGDS